MGRETCSSAAVNVLPYHRVMLLFKSVRKIVSAKAGSPAISNARGMSCIAVGFVLDTCNPSTAAYLMLQIQQFGQGDRRNLTACISKLSS